MPTIPDHPDALLTRNDTAAALTAAEGSDLPGHPCYEGEPGRRSGLPKIWAEAAVSLG